jgi:branched-chain amino acid transport system substrate-binding protein
MKENKLSLKVTRRDFLKAAAVAGCAAAAPAFLSGCGPGGSKDPLKIGLLIPKSGNWATYGVDNSNAIRFWFDVKMGGEVAGRKVEYVEEDDENNPEVGLQKTRKLVEQDNVDVIVGVVGSGVLMAIRDYIHEAQKLTIVTNAGANALSRGLKTPYIWRASMTNWMDSALWPYWAYKNLGKKAVAVVADYTAGHEVRNSMVYAFEDAGGTVVDQVLVPFPVMGDPAPIVADIASKDADFFYFFLPGAAGVALHQAAVDFDLFSKIPMFAAEGSASEDMLRAYGDSGEGIKSSWNWSYIDEIPENQAFIKEYTEKYEIPPSSYTVQAYDSARIISTMIERVEGDTSDVNAMVEALAGISFASPRGPFTLDEATQNPRQQWYLREAVRHTDGKIHNKTLENLGEVVDPGDDSKG